jgi:hypothetical protein
VHDTSQKIETKKNQTAGIPECLFFAFENFSLFLFLNIVKTRHDEQKSF